ncbi:MAG: phosphoribosylglycinamide formyltransferase [Halofilum sp. (in: g-proteobacteria)]|nr:phosphoribosylglycinamide formyltransferase [Halofilum sp. (in: g-proteobacteria)]
MTAALPVVVLVSGRGTNLRALLETHAAGWLPVEFRAVISNRPGAAALEHAAAHGVATAAVDHTAYPDRAAFDAALHEAIAPHRPALVILAGFMRILSDAFIAHYRERMMNIHPSLLPDFRGLHTHERALAAGVGRHGATVHFVTPELDGGPAVLQATVPVYAHDDAERLAARVLEREHRIFPLAVRWFAEGRLRFDGADAWLDGQRLPAPLIDPPEAEDVPLPAATA